MRCANGQKELAKKVIFEGAGRACERAVKKAIPLARNVGVVDSEWGELVRAVDAVFWKDMLVHVSSLQQGRWLYLDEI